MISSRNLEKWGREGWIIGPYETEEEFVFRIGMQQFFLKTPHILEKKAKISPLEPLGKIPKVINSLEKKLHVRPSWILIGYSNRSLSPWEGAVSWIFAWGTCIQLRKAFEKGRFLFYEREDVLFHEAVHSLRFAFHEPRFEEIIAYSFTKKRWRRFFGPLFFNTKQSYIFIATLLLAPFALYPAIIYLLWRGGCLIRNQHIFKKALLSIQKLFPHLSPFSVIIRLTDKEIQLFGNQNQKNIQDYIQSKKNDLRWKQLSFLTNLP